MLPKYQLAFAAVTQVHLLLSFSLKNDDWLLFAAEDLIDTGDVERTVYLTFCTENDIEPKIKKKKSSSSSSSSSSSYTSSGCGGGGYSSSRC